MSLPPNNLEVEGVPTTLTPMMMRKESIGTGRGEGSPLPRPHHLTQTEEIHGGHDNHDYTVTEDENVLEEELTHKKPEKNGLSKLGPVDDSDSIAIR